MSKQGLRAFSAGMIISTSLLAGFYYFEEPKEQEPTSEITEDSVNQYLQENGLLAIDQEHYEELVSLSEARPENTENEETEDGQANETDKVITKYTLEIKSGMNSKEIAEQLKHVGIIDNADDFYTYILERNLATKIQIGSFELSSDLSYEEITAKITR